MSYYTATLASIEAHAVKLRSGTVYVLEADGRAHCVPADVFELLYEQVEPPHEVTPELPHVQLAELPQLPQSATLPAGQTAAGTTQADLTPHQPDRIANPAVQHTQSHQHGAAKPALVKLLQERGPLDITAIGTALYPALEGMHREGNARQLIRKSELAGLIVRDLTGNKLRWVAK